VILGNAQTTSVAAEVGTLFHLHHKNFYEKVELPFNMTRKNVESYFRSCMPDDELTNYLLDNFAAFETDRWFRCVELERPDIFMPLATENEFFNDKKCTMGTIDRVDQLANGELAVGEIKSGNLGTWVRRELAFYVMSLEPPYFAETTFEIQPTYIFAYSPKENKSLFEKLHPNTIAALHRALDRARDTIDSENFECKTGFHCDWCRRVGVCTEYE